MLMCGPASGEGPMSCLHWHAYEAALPGHLVLLIVQLSAPVAPLSAAVLMFHLWWLCAPHLFLLGKMGVRRRSSFEPGMVCGAS